MDDVDMGARQTVPMGVPKRIARRELLQPTMTLRLVSNSYLDESTSKIRVKQVPWEVRSLAVPSLTLE
jgi:hypothetical protein